MKDFFTMTDGDYAGKSLTGTSFADITTVDKISLAPTFVAVTSTWHGYTFDGADLRGCNFNRCELINCSLVGANLQYANLTQIAFTECDLTLADLNNVHIDSPRFGEHLLMNVLV